MNRPLRHAVCTLYAPRRRSSTAATFRRRASTRSCSSSTSLRSSRQPIAAHDRHEPHRRLRTRRHRLLRRRGPRRACLPASTRMTSLTTSRRHAVSRLVKNRAQATTLCARAGRHASCADGRVARLDQRRPHLPFGALSQSLVRSR